MAEAASKPTVDWCHICGNRSNQLADIWYPNNAEHDPEPAQYIRICVSCADLIGDIGRGGAKPDRDASSGMVTWGKHTQGAKPIAVASAAAPPSNENEN